MAIDGCPLFQFFMLIMLLYTYISGWIDEVRNKNFGIKIVPRFLFDKWDPQKLSVFLSDQHEQDACFRIVLNFIKVQLC